MAYLILAFLIGLILAILGYFVYKNKTQFSEIGAVVFMYFGLLISVSSLPWWSATFLPDYVSLLLTYVGMPFAIVAITKLLFTKTAFHFRWHLPSFKRKAKESLPESIDDKVN